MLLRDPKCYTDVCINGRWYHYDHCGTKVYVLKGGHSPEIELGCEPLTEDELIHQIKRATAGK